MKALSVNVSQKDFAGIIGVSGPAVSSMAKRGIVDPESTLGEMLRAYCSHLREQAAGRDAAALPWANSKARKEAAGAEQAEIELARVKGTLVDRAGVERGAFQAMRMLRDALVEVLPVTVAPELAAMSDPWAVEVRLRQAIRETLQASAKGLRESATTSESGA